jgi:hypothetical protein
MQGDEWKRYPLMVRMLRDERERLAAADLDGNHRIAGASSPYGYAVEAVHPRAVPITDGSNLEARSPAAAR